MRSFLMFVPYMKKSSEGIPKISSSQEWDVGMDDAQNIIPSTIAIICAEDEKYREKPGYQYTCHSCKTSIFKEE